MVRATLPRPMLIGAHVSPAGGPAKAVERGVEKGCRAIQIFNQNPRAWRPRVYSDEEVSDFSAAMGDSDVDALRSKSLTSLISALDAGTALGAHCVVLHPGSAKAGEVGPAIERAGATIRE